MDALVTVGGALATDLEEYRERGLESLSPAARRGIAREDGLPALIEVRERTDRLALHLRFFLLGDQLSFGEFALAFPSVPLDQARAVGLVDAEGRSTVALTPVRVPEHHGGGRLLVASDFGALAGRSVGTDFVMPVGGATTTLANIARYQSGERVLDLGTGCGWHAILAARSGACVTATDISDRALALARLNASLAGVDITFIRTSLFDDLPDGFDVIVSNPPFVITPGIVRESVGTLTYRDGGAGILEAVVRGTTEHLAESGRAYILGNWELSSPVEEVPASEQWATPATWCGDRDVWVMLREVLDAPEYVAMWMRDSGATDRDLAAAWIEDFRNRGTQSIGLGYIMIGPTGAWARTEIYQGPIDGGFESGQRIWGNRTIDNYDDADFLALVLDRGPVTEERSYTPGLADPWRVRLTCAGRDVTVSGELAGFVGACDGSMSVDVIIGALAVLLDTPEAQLREVILPRARALVADGFLVPVPSSFSTSV